MRAGFELFISRMGYILLAIPNPALTASGCRPFALMPRSARRLRGQIFSFESNYRSNPVENLDLQTCNLQVTLFLRTLS